MSNALVLSHQSSRIDRKRLRALIAQQHAIQWAGSTVEELAEFVDTSSPEYIRRLRAFQRGCANLIYLTIHQYIPVKFSAGSQSYTVNDPKNPLIVLSAKLDPTKLDVLAGLSLHEASHIAESKQLFRFDTAFLQDTNKVRLSLTNSTVPVDAARITAKANGNAAEELTQDKITKYLRLIMNWLEDRRIDLWQWKQAPGYRPYYTALYKEYFYSEQISTMLASGMLTELAVENYMLHLINMINDNWNEKDLPGLAEIRSIADLSEKGILSRGNNDPNWYTWSNALKNLKEYPRIYRDAVSILEIMLKHSDHVQMQNEPQDSEDESDDSSGEGDGQSQKKSDIENLDMPDLGAIQKELDRQQQYVMGAIDKGSVGVDIGGTLDNLNATNATQIEVEGDFLPRDVKAMVTVYRDVSKETVMNNYFPFRSRGNRGMHAALNRGVQMGQILANNIASLSDESPIAFNHQKSGKLDKRRIASLGFGQEDIFSHNHIELRKPANLWIDIDFSGSMSGQKSEDATALAVAVAYAADQTKGLNVTIAVRDGDNNTARIAILYDSRRHSFSQLRDIVPIIGVNGGTPESLCFEALRDEILKAYPGERKYFINLSDGEPAYSFNYKGQSYVYGTKTAADHCKNLMNEFRASGIQVMSYFIGDGHSSSLFKQMYGDSARFIDPKNISSIIKTVNEFLMSEKK